MGTFRWPLRISSMDGQRTQDIEATVGFKDQLLSGYTTGYRRRLTLNSRLPIPFASYQ